MLESTRGVYVNASVGVVVGDGRECPEALYLIRALISQYNMLNSH